MLEIKDLNLAWKDVPIVCDVNINVAQGEVVGIIGRSGCGKTTLFQAIAGLLAPASGKILLDGRDITGKPGDISYMFQKDLLLPHLTVQDNVALPPLIAGNLPHKTCRERSLKLLEKFGLQDYASCWPHELSGGMKQRVALLRVCMMENEVVLLDEPFSALDGITRIEVRTWVMEQIRKMRMSCLFITHDCDEALLCADRVLVLGPYREATSVVAEIEIERPESEDFSLTPEFLKYKRQCLELLMSK